MTIRAEMLRQTGYLNAAEWCEHIRDHLNLYRKCPNELVVDLQRFLETFKNDFLNRVSTGNPVLREDCFTIIQVFLERAIANDANINETFKKLLPYADRSLAANKVIYKMDEEFNALDDSLLEVKVFGNLFTFLLHVDGQYFPTVRTICALKLAGDSQKIELKHIESLNMKEMEKIIGKFGSRLFEVYNSDGRHLRNSIAHCNFAYSNAKLTCWDKAWKKQYTISELFAVMNDLKSVAHAFVTWFLVRELAEKVSENIGHNGLELNFIYKADKK
jgi:hypothetical protein